MRAREVEIRIEELVLQGFAPGHGQAVGESIRIELARLLAEQGVPPGLLRGRPGAGPLDAGKVVLPPSANESTIGIHLARALHAELTR